jgi:hypothetical protein
LIRYLGDRDQVVPIAQSEVTIKKLKGWFEAVVPVNNRAGRPEMDNMWSMFTVWAIGIAALSVVLGILAFAVIFGRHDWSSSRRELPSAESRGILG